MLKTWYRNIQLILFVACLSLTACDSESQPTESEPDPTEATAPTPAASNPKVEILNYSHLPTDTLRAWTNQAEARVASRKSKVLSVIYPIGDYVGEMNAPWHHEGKVGAFEVMLSNTEIDAIMAKLTEFLSEGGCMAPEGQQQELTILRGWLETGYDSASQAALCDELRLIMIAVQPERTSEEVKITWQHELYHAFQHGLRFCETERAADQDTMWVVEGGAAMFSDALFLEERGEIDNLKTRVLRTALNVIKESNTELSDPGVAEKGAAALLYMVEKGWLSQESILDGSLYHQCTWVTDFRDDNPRINEVAQAWSQIQCTNDFCNFQ